MRRASEYRSMGRMGAGRIGEPRANQRLTVAQAAAQLGITEGAIRSRIKRGTLPTAREGGAVFVLLGDGTPTTNQAPNTGEPSDQTGLVGELRDRIRYLERQVEEEREARRRADLLLSRLMDRVPQLEAPTEAPGDAETVEEAPEGAEPRSATGGATGLQGTSLRGLRKRLLGW